ncbi:MAG: ribonuclease [Archaeoglobi archaeon]|nr:ribonuclease HII [Candidatus Mnemosynella bozhongmuii]MDK2781033.1 ribonuclease [Archaeoglobi archaeon]
MSVRICGVDEAGKGAVMGPLVIAGVLTDDEERLRSLNVRDSKTLSKRRREELFERIKEICEIKVVEIPAEELDERMREKTINEILLESYIEILSEMTPEVAYVDSVDVREERFGGRLSEALKCRIISKHRADSIYPPVSAASITAKVIRDRRIEEIKRELGFDIGSGYPADPKTREFLERWFREHREPPPHVRTSWKTVKRFLRGSSLF